MSDISHFDIYNYCERRGPGLFEEPMNTITNVAFIWAATESWNLAGRHRVCTWDISMMIILSAIVGVGSALWHIYPAPWTSLMDLVPILLFQLCFLWQYLRTCAGMRPIPAAVLLCGYVLCNVLMEQVPPWLNGSVLYAPTVVAIACLAVYHYRSKQPDRWLMGAFTLLFCAAITFRSIDRLACPYVPFGTHFLWHLLNGVVFFLAMRVIILKRVSQSAEMRFSPNGTTGCSHWREPVERF
jgi:hypothetical protein